MFSPIDHEFMGAALNIARRGLGRTASNPSVGCIIVSKKGHVAGLSHTADGGRPHAETIALLQAGRDAKGGIAYVTLEPCAHHGQTPPCAHALIEAGIARVVIACEDPDPRVAGRGMALLKEAGLQVETGLRKTEAAEINRGFFLRLLDKRPLVTLKIAATVQGVTGYKEQRWITGELARRHAHLERSLHDAIMVGIGTVLKDDPLLTTRLPGTDHKIRRIILDTHLQTSLASRLVQTAAESAVQIFFRNDAEHKAAALEKANVELSSVDPHDLRHILEALAGQGMTRLLVEGGPAVLHSFIKTGLYDRFLWYKAPGQAALKPESHLHAGDLEAVKALHHAETRVLGQDRLEIYENRA